MALMVAVRCLKDAEAICEAVGRPNMRFVPIKTEAQQAVLALHRTHSLSRT
jgi:transposase